MMQASRKRKQFDGGDTRRVGGMPKEHFQFSKRPQNAFSAILVESFCVIKMPGEDHAYSDFFECFNARNKNTTLWCS